MAKAVESHTFFNPAMEALANQKHTSIVEEGEGVQLRMRAFLVALLGVSISACAFASQPVELEIEDDDVSQRLSNVSFVRRITKPTIRIIMGYGKLSAFVTVLTSLLLLVSIMSRQSWWNRGARWLAVPALLVAALEATSDAADAVLASILRGSTELKLLAGNTLAATMLVTAEMLVWYFIAKFFEYKPPIEEQDNKIKALADQQNITTHDQGKMEKNEANPLKFQD